MVARCGSLQKTIIIIMKIISLSLGLLFLLAMMFLFLLPSCGVPVRVNVTGPQGSVGYSSKSGLAVDVAGLAIRGGKLTADK